MLERYRSIPYTLGMTKPALSDELRYILLAAGWVRAGNFVKSENKVRYAYLLTPKGFSEKAEVILCFLENKQRQYEHLK